MVAVAKPDNRIAQPQKSNEWYTPAKYIEAARSVMGGIDLDPASCALANQTVKASRYYTKEDDGLSKPWYGRVWMNPPYSDTNSSIGIMGSQHGPRKLFIKKLLSGYENGDIEQAILLTNSDTDAAWFIPLWDYPICFASKRIRFFGSENAKKGQFFGSAFVYLGPNEQSFIEHFSAFGRIARAIDTPKPVSKPCELWEVL